MHVSLPTEIGKGAVRGSPRADGLSVVSPGEAISGALRKLSAREVDQVPVVEEGHLRGILRRADILRWMELQSAV